LPEATELIQFLLTEELTILSSCFPRYSCKNISMGILPLAIAISLILSPAGNATRQMLFLSGGSEPLDNQQMFYDDVKMEWGIAESRGFEPSVVEAKGDWDFAKKGAIFPARKKEDLEAAIKLAASKLQPGEPLTLFISGHGAPAESVSDPLDGKMELYTPYFFGVPAITARELMEMLKKNVPADHNVKLVGLQCYAGSLHSISFQMPNACSAAYTDFRSPGIAGIIGDSHNRYAEGFWQELDDKHINYRGDGKTSLYEAHLAGTIFDDLNEGRGQLSSMAYVDSVLGKGAYDGNRFWDFLKYLHYARIRVGRGEKGVEFPRLCDLNSGMVDESGLEKLVSETGDILEADAFAVAKPSDEIKPLNSVYRAMLEDWKKNKDKYLSTLNELKIEFATAQGIYESGNSMKQRIDRWPAFAAKVLETNDKMRKELYPLFAIFQTMQRFDRINVFLAKATPEQKQTFKRLLNCEWQPL
jgi:hypothetical protein